MAVSGQSDGVVLTEENAVGLVAWGWAENTSAAWNVYDSTEPWPGSTRFNNVGVRNYPNWLAGIAATWATLRNGDYGPVIAALKSGEHAEDLAEAVADSPWGTEPFIPEVVAVRSNICRYYGRVVVGTMPTP
jgi:hypothetical protein